MSCHWLDLTRLFVCLLNWTIFICAGKHSKADEATQKLLKKTAINAVNIADRNKDGKITFDEYEFFVSI